MKLRIIIVTLLLTGILVTISSCSKESKGKNTIKIISITPSSPAELSFGEFVLIRFEYKITHPEGARMWVQPYTNGEKSPKFLYSSSKVFNGEGGKEVGISVESGNQPILVDQLRVVMITPDKEKTLYEIFMDVNFTFK